MRNIGVRAALRRWFFAAIGYVLLLVAAIIFLGAAVAVWNMVTALPKEIATPIIAWFFTIVVTVGSLVFSRRLERQREIEQELRKQKLPVYEEFQTFWIKLLMQHKPGMSRVPEKEIVRFMADFTPKLMLWGSDALLRRYAAFREQANIVS